MELITSRQNNTAEYAPRVIMIQIANQKFILDYVYHTFSKEHFVPFVTGRFLSDSRKGSKEQNYINIKLPKVSIFL
jgi:hypothetical protein